MDNRRKKTVKEKDRHIPKTLELIQHYKYVRENKKSTIPDTLITSTEIKINEVPKQRKRKKIEKNKII